MLYIGALLFLCGVVAAINAAVDPHGRLLIVDTEGFNQTKISPDNNRSGKARSLRQCSYDTLILGTSRAESGIRVEQAALEGAHAYNGALKAATMYEMRRVADYALANQQLQTVVIGLDLSSFNAKDQGLDDFDESPFADSISFAAWGRYLVSWKTLKHSWYTWEWNHDGNTVTCEDRGEYKPRPGAQASANIRTAFDFVLKRYASGQYPDFTLGKQHLADFAATVNTLADADVQVYAFISPMHATHLELMREMGMLDKYDNWRRKLVSIVEETNKRVGNNTTVQLWDFSGYNTITTETVPAPLENTVMRWYRDSAHYNHDAGDILMSQVFGIPSPEPGVRLTSANIDAVIGAERAQSDKYRAAHPEEIKRLQEMLLGAPYKISWDF
jgi:hypothetical protein